MVSFMNMRYCCRYACFVMNCFVMSESSSQRCLHNSVNAMLCFLLSLNLLTKLAMFTWVPSYLLILFGSWSVKDFCSMQLVDSCHAFFAMLRSCSMFFDSSKHCNLMIILQSLKLLLFAIFPCPFEHVLVVSGDSSVFMSCCALPVLHAHAFCSYVGVL